MLILVAELQGVVALHPREVDLGVDECRILPLRVGALATEAGEASDPDGWQTSGYHGVVSGQAGDVVEGGVSDGQVELAGLGAVEAEADVEDLGPAEEAGVAEGDLLIEDADVAIGLAVEGDGNARVVDAVLLAVADTNKRRVDGIDLPVEAEVALVGVIGEGNLDGVVVGGKTRARQAGDGKAGGLLEVGNNLCRKRVDRASRDRGQVRSGLQRINHTRRGILYGDDEVSVQFVLCRQGEYAERLEYLAEAFIVEEEEEFVLDDGSAEVDAELVAIKRGLTKGNGVAPVLLTVRGLKNPAALRAVLRMNS